MRSVQRVLRTIRPPADADLSGGPLPRHLLEQCWPVLLELDGEVQLPLMISATPVKVGQRVALVGFPRSDARVPDEVFAALFAGAAGAKHVMPGAVLRATGNGVLFDYDSFSADGTRRGTRA